MCTRWSGHGAPTVTSCSASTLETNSSARSEVSTVSTFERSEDTAPRIAGSSSFNSPGFSTASLRPPKRGVSPVRSLTNATAWLMTSIVLRYASSAVSPHTIRPCLASTTSLRSGFSRTAIATCLDSVKPGRM